MRLGHLSRHLHRIFDLAPDPVLGLRVNAGATGLGWEIVGDTLTLTPDDGDPQVFDLSAHTLSSLGVACVAAGFTVPVVNSEISSRSAACLLPGTGHSATSNGDHLLATQNLTLLLLDALGIQVETAAEDLLDALDQMWPLQADGEWADYWGRHFGIWRRDGESDADYTVRVFVEICRPRANRFALIDILSEVAGTPVRVFEPWTRVMHASGYACGLSRTRLRDRMLWTHGTIECCGAERDILAPVVERNRAAGVLPRYCHPVELALVSEPTLASVWSGVGFLDAGGSSAVRWVERFLPAGVVTGGSEPWRWTTQGGLPAHASILVDGYPHEHWVTGLAARTCPEGWRLATLVWLDADSPPDTLLLGWRCDGDWSYAFWGADSRTESPREDLGDLPVAGRWVLLLVDPVADLGLDADAAIDGLFFGCYGGRAYFGTSGARLPASGQYDGIICYFLGSGGSAYQIDGVTQTDLYTLDGDYVSVLGLTAEYGESLYRLDAPGDGVTQHDLIAGEGWRLGDLILAGYLAGADEVDLTQATWVSGMSGAMVEVTQTA